MSHTDAQQEGADVKTPREKAARRADSATLSQAEIGYLRFVAGMRALLAALCGVVLIVDADLAPRQALVVVCAYMTWSAFLLYRTQQGWRHAAARGWLWLDSAVLLAVSGVVVGTMPLFGIATVLPVVALAVLAGPRPAVLLALVNAASLLLLALAADGIAPLPLPAGVAIAVLALGPAAAWIARPSRDLRERLRIIDVLHERSDPRQGLRHHVATVLDELAVRHGLSGAAIGLRGPQPRIFLWRPDAATAELAEGESLRWSERLAVLPRQLGCLCSNGERGVRAVLCQPVGGARAGVPDAPARDALAGLGQQALSLPLLSYGQPLGTLVLFRVEPAFASSDVQWLHALMREIMPLLERSDLLEQLQRETAAHERERIGRDLHDRAIQPYLGIKYGLEALARRAGAGNPVSVQIAELVQIATDELENLRDVIGGLRRGGDPGRGGGAPLEALQREARRFETLYGLKVTVQADGAPRLRGAVARAVLDMVNEALTNTRRHTAATAVWIELATADDALCLRVRNNLGERRLSRQDFMPASISQRANELGGSVTVHLTPDWTEVQVTMPLWGAIG